jgi:hypothetical protein
MEPCLGANAGFDEVTDAEVGAEDRGRLVTPAGEVGTGGAGQTPLDVGGLVGMTGPCECQPDLPPCYVPASILVPAR